MYESIPLADFMNEFKNFMSCWKSIVFAGIAIREEQYYNPVALQAWAGSDDREHTAVFNTPELPNGICMFKATRWLTKAWPMIEDIIGQKKISQYIPSHDIPSGYINSLVWWQLSMGNLACVYIYLRRAN